MVNRLVVLRNSDLYRINKLKAWQVSIDRLRELVVHKDTLHHAATTT